MLEYFVNDSMEREDEEYWGLRINDTNNEWQALHCNSSVQNNLIIIFKIIIIIIITYTSNVSDTIKVR